MIQLRFVPIENWPGEQTKYRKQTPFLATYLQTLVLLESELNHLRAKEIVLQVAIAWGDVRNDGMPKANAAFRHPGVILTFETGQVEKNSLSFPCDTYTHWHANLRAVTLSLQALRAVNRYGVTRRAEQYQGWKQIAPPPDRPFADTRAAAAFLSQSAYGHQDAAEVNGIRTDKEFRQNVYRRAAAELHPDAPNGSHELFVRLQAALRLLEES